MKVQFDVTVGTSAASVSVFENVKTVTGHHRAGRPAL